MTAIERSREGGEPTRSEPAVRAADRPSRGFGSSIGRWIKTLLVVGTLVVTAEVLGALAQVVGYLGALATLVWADVSPGPVIAESWAMFGAGVAGSVAWILFSVLYLRRRRGGVGVRVPTRREVYWIAAGVPVVLGLSLGLGYVETLVGIVPADQGFGAVEPRWLYVGYAAVSILFVGPGEELLHRGVIQGRLRDAFGPLVSIVAASAVFAAVHVFGLSGSPAGVWFAVGTIFAISLVLGYAYERTGNLVVVMAIHGLYNAILFCLAYLGVL